MQRYTKGDESLSAQVLQSLNWFTREDHSKEATKWFFFKSPFIGPFSLLVQRKINIVAN